MGTHDRSCAMCGCSRLKFNSKWCRNPAPRYQSKNWFETSKPCRPCQSYPTWKTLPLRPLLTLWANWLLIIFWKLQIGLHRPRPGHPPASFLCVAGKVSTFLALGHSLVDWKSFYMKKSFSTCAIPLLDCSLDRREFAFPSLYLQSMSSVHLEFQNDCS